MYGHAAFAAAIKVATKPTPLLPHRANASGVDVHLFGGLLQEGMLSARHNVFSIPVPMDLPASDPQDKWHSQHPLAPFKQPLLPKAPGRHLRGPGSHRTATAAVRRASAPAGDPAVLPGVDYLSYGYNVVKGFPLATTYNNGWATQGVADIACSSCFSENRTFYGPGNQTCTQP